MSHDPFIGVVTGVEPKTRTITVELADLNGVAIRTLGERWLRGASLFRGRTPVSRPSARA